ncbi:BQ5605_C005g03554 [Microbotryum silenes-dioicae]|uniref:BQ5605_C005g03554 protein n=1 Tax=Microbotryum silenes-dioicae TaxID=796604 RepID=A0A2X0MY41_9BASI|nr:BQ5605_C005g03554 [Microbotryum silenes-dioicae]
MLISQFTISELGLKRGSRSYQHGEQVQYTYHGPNRFVASHSLDDDLVIKCSLRQLVLSNVKLRLERLQIICQTHNLQGYSFRQSRARELFLRILLSSCTESCPACESGYIFKRSTANDILVPRRHCVPRHTVYRHKTLESCQAELSKEICEREERALAENATQNRRRAATNNDSRADDDTRLSSS